MLENDGVGQRSGVRPVAGGVKSQKKSKVRRWSVSRKAVVSGETPGPPGLPERQPPRASAARGGAGGGGGRGGRRGPGGGGQGSRRGPAGRGRPRCAGDDSSEGVLDAD